MKNYNLTNFDYDQIINLMKLTMSINELYTKLYKLEINNKKDTEEYKKEVELLKILLDEETKTYKEYNLTQAKSMEWIGYLISKKSSNIIKTDIETIMNQDYNSRIVNRIINKLYSNIEVSRIDNIIFSSIKEEIKNDELDIPDEFITNSITSSLKIRKSFECDIFNLYLSFLSEKIKDGNFKSIKNQLIDSKYNFSFINKNIEDSMISKNFELDNTFYIGSKMTAELYRITPELYTFLKDTYGLQMLLDQIIELLKIADDDYSNTTKLTTAVLRQNLIKAILLTFDDETLIDVKSEYKDVMEKEIYSIKSKSNNMSKGIINDCFKNIQKERNKVNVLSLNKNK